MGEHILLIHEIYLSNRKESYLYKTHLTIKKTIKYSHDKTLKDKKNCGHRIRTAVSVFKFGGDIWKETRRLVVATRALFCAELHVIPLTALKRVACQILPGMIQEPTQKTAGFPLCHYLRLRGRKQRWCSEPQRVGWGEVLTWQVSWEQKQRGKLV